MIAIKANEITKIYKISNDRKRTKTNTVKDYLTHYFKEKNEEQFFALNNISFEIKLGEKVGIIGRNGAGKSTLLKVLSRIIRPTSGTVKTYGRIASLLEVGTGFHPELSGKENIYLNGSILGMSKGEIKNKFDEIVAFSEVEKFLNTPVKKYSSGMYVRLAFAVAAHLEPEILIVDEVLAVGDAAFQEKCLGKMNDVANEGRTILFVSHNMQAVQQLCNKGMYIQNGNMVYTGDMVSTVSKYLYSSKEKAIITYFEINKDTIINDGYLLYAKIIGFDNKDLQSVNTGQKWKLVIGFRLNRRLDNLILAIGINSSLNMPINTTWSRPEEYEDGDYEAIFSMDQYLLAPGIYNIIVGLSNQNRSIHHDYDTMTVEVSDILDDNLPKTIQNTTAQTGIILNQVDVKFKRV